MNNILTLSCLVLSFLVSIAPGNATTLSNFEVEQGLKGAFVRIEGNQLVANTGKVERRWKLGKSGLVTTGLRQLSSGKEWVTMTPSFESDWQYQDLTNKGILVSLGAEVSDDDGFTGQHIELNAEFHYAKIAVQYIVWIYPNSDGFRTQLKVKKLTSLDGKVSPYDLTTHKDFDKKSYANFVARSQVVTGRTEYLPVKVKDQPMRAVGYYNHTQGRNHADTLILRDKSVSEGEVEWASILSLQSNAGGLILVKESHKTANQAGLNTGIFRSGRNGIEATGWGILPQEISDKYQGYWANWIIIHDGTSPLESELSLKRFDRVRYPVDLDRDVYLMANTWGSGETKNWSQSAAREANVMLEIDSQADLGLDIQQIDDGWQGWATGGTNWRPVPVLDYSTRPLKKSNNMGDGEKFDKTAEKFEMYPQGWVNVKQHAQEKGVRLGLWCHSRIPLEDLKWNFDQGGFKSYKIDFLNFNKFQSLNETMNKVRDFVLYSDHQVRMNWDVTEHPPRIGYFFAREYGNVYLANRKTMSPAEVVYVPYLVLRDAWQLAKYANLNKFQISVQNGERCNPKVSDAAQHQPDFLVAQTLMGSPIFFQETHYYSAQARAQIKPLISTYKKVREQMYKGYVFPIGDLPDNKSWSGFQNHNPDNGSGFLTIFRQLQNKQSQQSLKLNFLQDKKIVLNNLMTGESRTLVVNAEGLVNFEIKQPSGFLFLSYQQKSLNE